MKLTSNPLFVFVLAGTLLGETAVANAECPQSAQKFWQEFRQLVLKGDKQKVTGYVAFPLEQKGTLDSSKLRKLTREDFLARFDSYMNADPGLSLTPSTMANLIKSTPVLTPKLCSSSGREFRVGDWRFELKLQGWRLTRAYVEE